MTVDELIEYGIAENVDFYTLVEKADTYTNIDFIELINKYHRMYNLSDYNFRLNWTIFDKHNVDHPILTENAFNSFNTLPWIRSFVLNIDEPAYLNYLNKSLSRIDFDAIKPGRCENADWGSKAFIFTYKLWENSIKDIGFQTQDDLEIAAACLTKYGAVVNADYQMLYTHLKVSYEKDGWGVIHRSLFNNDQLYHMLTSEAWVKNMDFKKLSSELSPLSYACLLSVHTSSKKDISDELKELQNHFICNLVCHAFDNASYIFTPTDIHVWSRPAVEHKPYDAQLTRYLFCYVLLFDDYYIKNDSYNFLEVSFPGYKDPIQKKKYIAEYFPELDRAKCLLSLIPISDLVKSLCDRRPTEYLSISELNL